MFGNQKILIKLSKNYSSEVVLGDGELQSIESKGTIEVFTKGGNNSLKEDV